MRPSGQLLIQSVALTLASACLVACGSSTSKQSAEPATSPDPSATLGESGSPSPSTSPDAEPTRLPAEAPAEERLLGPADLPGFNEDWTWTTSSTAPVRARNFGRCAKFDVLSIGALDGSQRDYRDQAHPRSPDRAAMQVLTFPDAKTAQRATAVIESWHQDCRARLKSSLPQRSAPQVGPLQDVPVPLGSARWYLVSWAVPGHPGEGHFHAFGIATVEARMALVSMDNLGQDRNYEPGQDPMELAVAAAAARL